MSLTSFISSLCCNYENSSGFVFFKNIRSQYLYANANMRCAARGLDLKGAFDDDMPWGCFSEKYQFDDNRVFQGNFVEVFQPFIFKGSRVHVKVLKLPILKDGEIVGVLGQAHLLEQNNLQHQKYIEMIDKQFSQGQFEGLISNVSPLTKRQIQVLWLLLRGYSARETSEILAISKRTVETHIETIKMTHGCVGRVGLVKLGFKLGLHLQTAEYCNITMNDSE